MKYIFNIIFLIGSLIRFLLSFEIPGVIHPDEHYQGLEIAHYLVYGYGELTWEWRLSEIAPIRSIMFPLQLAFIMKIGSIIGLDYELILFLTRLWTAILSSLLIILVYYFVFLLIPESMNLKSRKNIALIASFLIAINSVLLKYSWHTFTNVYVLPFIIASLILLIKKYESYKRMVSGCIIGGLFMSYSLILRPEIIIFYIIFFIFNVKYLLAKKTIYWIIGIFFGQIISGIFDFLFYGTSPFQTTINFLIFQTEGSEFWGIQPFGYYSYLFLSKNVVNIFLLIFSFLYIIISLGVILYKSRDFSLFFKNTKRDVLLIRLIKFSGITFLYLLFWEVISHKEERFLLPWLVFFLIFQSLTIFLMIRTGLFVSTKINNRFKVFDKNNFLIIMNQLKYSFIALVLFILVVQNSFLFLNSDSTPYQEIELSVLYVGKQQDVTGLVVVFSRPHYIGTMAYLHQPNIPVLRITNSFLYENYSFIFPVRYNYLIIPHEYYSEFEFITSDLFKGKYIIDKTVNGDYPVDVWKLSN